MALTAADLRFITLSFEEARRSLDHGGLPIGSALARGEQLIASAHNQSASRATRSPRPKARVWSSTRQSLSAVTKPSCAAVASR